MNKYILMLSFIMATVLVQAKEVKVVSPDKKTVITFSTKSKDENGLTYSITHQGSVIIATSPLGLEFENENSLSANLTMVAVNQKSVKLNWKPVYGERNLYPDNYSEAIIQFKENLTPFRSFSITCRVYNEGVAFRYNM